MLIGALRVTRVHRPMRCPDHQTQIRREMTIPKSAVNGMRRKNTFTDPSNNDDNAMSVREISINIAYTVKLRSAAFNGVQSVTTKSRTCLHVTCIFYAQQFVFELCGRLNWFYRQLLSARSIPPDGSVWTYINSLIFARQRAMLLPFCLSVCLSVHCWYCVLTNGYVVTLFYILVEASF